MRRLQIAVLVTLTALFVAVYGGCNALTSRRHDVGVIRFDWESAIPVVPAMIVPYMSIDLLFLAAPFLCRSRRELLTFAARFVAALAVAGAFFLVLPLGMDEPRPDLPGAWGLIHDLLVSFDQPHNMFPSLHVAFLTIMWPIYAGRWRRGPASLAVHAWFVLILSSVLLVRQHYVIDLVGGAILGVACVYAFPVGRPDAGPGRPDRRLGLRCTLAAAALAVAGFAALPWTVVLAWPATALLLVGVAYMQGRPAVFRKTSGRVPLATRVVLAPYLAPLAASRWWFRRADTARDEIEPGLWLGHLPRRGDAAGLAADGIVAVLDLTAEHGAPSAVRDLEYGSVPMLDLVPPSADQLAAARRFLEAVLAKRRSPGAVLVCCGLGYGRSGIVVASHLYACGRAATPEHAIEIVRRRRPRVVIRPEHIR